MLRRHSAAKTVQTMLKWRQDAAATKILRIFALFPKGIITAFTLDMNYIYYCIGNAANEPFQIVKSDFAGINKSTLAEDIFANKLSVIGDNLIYSDMGGVGS